MTLAAKILKNARTNASKLYPITKVGAETWAVHTKGALVGMIRSHVDAGGTMWFKVVEADTDTKPQHRWHKTLNGAYVDLVGAHFFNR